MSRFAQKFLIASLLVVSACSSGPEVKKQAYAEHPNERTFEYEFPVVWKGIEEATRKFHVVDRDPKDVDANEMRRLKHRTLETDWIMTQSNDKYVEYQVNGVPRKKYLMSRLKYKIDAHTVIGGTDVKIDTQEEIEKIGPDGDTLGWSKADELDTARAADLLDRINMAILSAAP